jgi:ankyrin repeat protein
MVNLLLAQENIDVNIEIIHDNTPLEIASTKGNLEIIYDNTPLEIASTEGNIEIIYGNTPLEIASVKGNLEIVKALLEKKIQDLSLAKATVLAFKKNKFDILEEFYKKIAIDDLTPRIFSFQIFLLEEKSADEDKINKSLEMLFNFLSEDKKIQLLTWQKNDKTILDCAIENDCYSVASLIYSKSIDLIYENDDECQAMKSQILIKALKNYNNEAEFFEFIKLVNGNEKLLPEHETEIQRLKLQESPEDQIKIDNALAEIKKPEKKHLSNVWELYRDGDLEGFKLLLTQDPTKIISFKYIQLVIYINIRLFFSFPYFTNLVFHTQNLNQE